MEKIAIETTVKAPIDLIWKCWTEPEHITKWCNASDDWHAPSATNDLREGGRFKTRMEAKDGSAGFDFEGTYTAVSQNGENRKISYKMDDSREVDIEFMPINDDTPDTYIVRETFDPEHENSIEMQRSGWQAILENFKKYVLAQ